MRTALRDKGKKATDSAGLEVVLEAARIVNSSLVPQDVLGHILAYARRLLPDSRVTLLLQETPGGSEPAWNGSKVVIPLAAGGTAHAALAVVGAEGLAEDVELRRLLLLLAGYAGVALRNAMAYQQAHHRAITDSLTGLYNRQYFDHVFPLECQRARRYRYPLALIMADMDGLKGINDTFGHPTGDAYIRAAAAVLQSCVRQVDYAFRYGGDEFVLLLPCTDEAGGLRVIERIEARVQSWNKGRHLDKDGARNHGGDIPPWPLGISLGVAASQVPVPEELLRLADRRMYEAKEDRLVRSPGNR